jgi:sugar phosphate isomerase/epimerase
LVVAAAAATIENCTTIIKYPSCIIMVSNLKIGIQTRSLRQPLKKALQTAARLGADGVEVDLRTELPMAELSHTSIRQFRKQLEDLNLRLSAVAFPTRRGYDVLEALDRRILATQQAMTLAYQLGTSFVVNRVGSVPPDTEDPRFELLTASLTALGAHGERVGARIAAQTGSESGEQLKQLIEALPEQAIGVDFHPNGLILQGHSPQEAIVDLGPWVVHVHACDAVRNLSGGQGAEVELGRGMAEFPSLLGQLEEFGYRDWVTIERHDSVDPIAEVGNAIAYLRELTH